MEARTKARAENVDVCVHVGAFGVGELGVGSVNEKTTPSTLFFETSEISEGGVPGKGVDKT